METEMENKEGDILRSEKSKIQGIVKELMSNSLNAEATEIKVQVDRGKEKTVIKVTDNGKGMDEKTLKGVLDLLNQPRRDELEDYYGGLAGNSQTASGLNIVGMLVDEAKVFSEEGKGTTVEVVRYKR